MTKNKENCGCDGNCLCETDDGFFESYRETTENGRKVFSIDVGNMTQEQAEMALEQLKTKVKENNSGTNSKKMLLNEAIETTGLANSFGGFE